MKILLGSKSPRRQELLNAAGISYELVGMDCEENYPLTLNPKKVAQYLALKKSLAYNPILKNEILLTADTTVYLEGEIINKPIDKDDAIKMLMKLNGKMHTVFTGVCLRTNTLKISFTEKTNVYFKALSLNQIQFYVENFHTLDKAGSYGIQDWIGYIGIRKINGDFFNVMGLPINRVYDEIIRLTEKTL